MNTKAIFLAVSLFLPLCGHGQASPPAKPRIIVSTDIGGTDPDDNQSMAHLLMYSDRFDIEGIVSSPSYGKGSKEEILRMIDLYAQDYPKLRRHNKQLMKPSALRRLCKQGHRGLFTIKGYDKPTEGSEWIIRQARKKSDRPLWILVWGTLEDVAQALHDAPDIVPRIRVYFIGGANKKWGVCGYNYIVSNFPTLWFIENNGSYRGFISENKLNDKYNTGYFDYAIKGAGSLGDDFRNYYNGIVKMGDTPSLLYMMDGDPENPGKACWGGQFTKVGQSARRVFDRQLTVADTVPVYSVVEMIFRGPELAIPPDSVCFTATIDKQQWAGYHTGYGAYTLLYSPKSPARLSYVTASPISQLDGLTGEFVADGSWPGDASEQNYNVGQHWYSDLPQAELYRQRWQGAATTYKWRNDVLDDWAARWNWLKGNE